jgi:putative Holliday junction resolvase
LPVPLVSLTDLIAHPLPEARALGLDLGTKTLGVAVATLAGGIATPLLTVRRTRFTADAEAVFRLMERERAGLLVLGLPLNMDGSAGLRVQSTRAFASNLLRLRNVPILLQDERLSTVEADDILARAGVSSARRREMIDAAAAAVILGDALKALAEVRRIP